MMLKAFQESSEGKFECFGKKKSVVTIAAQIGVIGVWKEMEQCYLRHITDEEIVVK